MRAFGLLLMIGVVASLACETKNDPVVVPSASPSMPSAMPSPSASASSSAPTPADDRVALLQRTLELDHLRPFWHPDVPGRSPLRIQKNANVADAPPLVMFGAPVVYVDDDAKAFAITKVDIAPSRARIEFRFAREGVAGHAEFRREGDRWSLVDERVVER